MTDRSDLNGTLAGGFPRAYLRPSLLLLLGEAPSHGYDLLEQVRALGMRVAEPGGLYRALRAMDEEGLVRSWWEPSLSGPARRLYVITEDGRHALREWATELALLRHLIDGILDRCQELPDLPNDEPDRCP